MQIILANPRGFCAGVDRAIGIVERALELFGAPVYVRHEVVHNKYVVDGLRDTAGPWFAADRVTLYASTLGAKSAPRMIVPSHVCSPAWSDRKSVV